ncbi:peptide/nickel transport system ATP-binding protein [Jatrophihabitans sp. GAS493]|uniref:dipeptide ABC transporter ATP-binding protein n=1 Tax=Jatrophihabitans sp. GAS493 TaxID=1907575 RepID=UPI000BC09BE7|nr:ABC transporter ATP-binding protein [Jatrophihabitans sp. GAS493]SOD74239.1 peptide/nickel transport system ATP-binding protein [Jatrophihabitans sp. GAS493]
MTTTAPTFETTPAPVADDDIVAATEDLNVTFRRAGRDIFALRGVSLQIRRGEILGLVGESGSGKSVLGLSLLGLHDHRATITGRVLVRGTDMAQASDAKWREMRKLHLGAVFQDPMTSLNPTMRVGRQVAEAAGSEKEALRLLTAVGIPEPKQRLAAYPHELSGGLRQRVMIAMAVAGGPSLVIADEPTTALDVTVQAQVLTLLRSLRDEIGCSVLMITHDLGVAAQVADRVAVMYAGRLAELGATQTVLNSAAHPYPLALMRSRLSLNVDRDRPLIALGGDVPSPADPRPGCAFSPRCELAGPDCEITPPPPVQVAPGHLSACILPMAEVRTRTAEIERTMIAAQQAPEIDAESAALTVRAVTKSFVLKSGFRHSNRLQALRGVNLQIARGESVALVGESGSGKSTLLRVVAGLESHDGGSLDLAGERPQMVFQDSGASLTPWMTVEEIIGERVKGLGRKAKAEKIRDALALVGLPAEVAKAKSTQLSGGQRQRVCLARATVVPPSILLCDEPTSALDVSLAASVINLISRLRRELGMSVLFVTHDLSVARIVADRIAVMYLGRIVEIGDAQQITGDPVHPYSKALISAVPDVGVEPVVLPGEPASALRPPPGCAFNPRCLQSVDGCADPMLDVKLTAFGENELHQVACINPKGN